MTGDSIAKVQFSLCCSLFCHPQVFLPCLGCTFHGVFAGCSMVFFFLDCTTSEMMWCCVGITVGLVVFAELFIRSRISLQLLLLHSICENVASRWQNHTLFCLHLQRHRCDLRLCFSLSLSFCFNLGLCLSLN